MPEEEKTIEQLSEEIEELLLQINSMQFSEKNHGHRHDDIRGGWARDIFKTFEDPESFSTEAKAAIPAGTIIVREGSTPRRVYFRTTSGLYKLVASGTTDAASGHSHTITDVNVNFKAI